MIRNGKWFSEDTAENLGKENSNNLASALASTKTTNQQPTIIYGGVSKSNSDSNGLGNLLSAGSSLLGGLFNKNNKTSEVVDGGNSLLNLGTSITNRINGTGGGGLGYLGIATGGINGLNKAFTDEDKMQGGFGNFAQGLFGIDDSNDSEVMQGLKGTANGALMGTTIFPGIGTIVGGLLGLGSSFLDDI